MHARYPPAQVEEREDKVRAKLLAAGSLRPSAGAWQVASKVGRWGLNKLVVVSPPPVPQPAASSLQLIACSSHHYSGPIGPQGPQFRNQ